MEFFLEKTLPQFNQAGTCLDWTWGELYSKFENVLADCYKMTWLKVLHNHLVPKLLKAKTNVTAPKQNREVNLNFYVVINLSIKKVINNKKPRDLQYIYMAPGGDHVIKKDLLTLLSALSLIQQDAAHRQAFASQQDCEANQITYS